MGKNNLFKTRYLCVKTSKHYNSIGMETTTSEKVALVTGSAMGIGLACAEAFCKAGYVTVLADIKEPVEQAAGLVKEGYKAVAYRCDVSNAHEVENMVDWIASTYGHLDAAHNNAGIQTPQRPMAEITDDEFDRTVAVDLKGVWNCMHYEIMLMQKQGYGNIVNTSSADWSDSRGRLPT